jgi:hypothetical protein
MSLVYRLDCREPRSASPILLTLDFSTSLFDLGQSNRNVCTVDVPSVNIVFIESHESNIEQHRI